MSSPSPPTSRSSSSSSSPPHQIFLSPLHPHLPLPPTMFPILPPPPYPYVQPNAPVQQYHNIQPQIQYVYLPTPHTNTLENNVPQTSHIPELKTRADWAAWYHGVQNLLTSRAIFTHICDPPTPHIAQDPMNTPSFPPILHPYPLPQQTQEWITWHRKDAIVYGVLNIKAITRDPWNDPTLDGSWGQAPIAQRERPSTSYADVTVVETSNMRYSNINDLRSYIAPPSIAFPNSFNLGPCSPKPYETQKATHSHMQLSA